MDGAGQTGIIKACLPAESPLLAVPPKWLAHESPFPSSQAPPDCESPPQTSFLLQGVVTKVPRASKAPQLSRAQLITKEEIDGLIDANMDLRHAAAALGVW